MLTNTEIQKGLKYSIAEGIFAHLYANFTGSIFLPAFVLLLMANDFTIGVLASIPFFSTIAQIIGSILVERYKKRKKIALLYAFVSRIMWVPIVILIILFFDYDKSLLLMLLIGFIIIHHIIGSLAGVAWLSWISNLVPPIIRGRFFGLRNSLLGIITILATIIGGYFLDWYKLNYPCYSESYSFLIIFSIAIIAGMISLTLLSRQPDMEEPATKTISIKSIFSQPLKHVPFKRMLRFGTIWSFAVNFASPFYIVYMLRDLDLSYTLVSTVIICSALADLIGMGFWGNFSDAHGNRPVIIITAATASIFPLIWLFTGTSALSVIILIPLLHMAGGFFFAGYNLCSINMIFEMAPRQNNSMFIALWSMANGVAAGLGAISGGLFAMQMKSWLIFLPFSGILFLKLFFYYQHSCELFQYLY